MKKRKYLSGSFRRKIWERDGKKCKKCGCDTVLFGNSVSPFRTPPCAVDHIKPFSKGGECEESNFQALCITYNAQKGAKYV